jgi:hypothetical protein
VQGIVASGQFLQVTHQPIGRGVDHIAVRFEQLDP